MRSIILLLALLSPSGARACSCVDNDDIDQVIAEEWQWAQTVVLAAAEHAAADWSDNPTSTQRVRWRVITSWRGPYGPGDAFHTDTVVDGGSCGVVVEVGERRILYLGANNQHEVHSCSVSSRFDAQRQLPVLDRLRDEAGAQSAK